MSRRAVTLIGILLGVLFSTAAPSSAILNGQYDENRHPYVGIIFNSDLTCSAAAISPTVLVTAAHCVTGGQGTPFRVSFEPGPDGTSAGVYDGKGYRLTDFAPTYKGLPGFASPDLAVVVLDQPVTLPRYAQLPEPGTVDGLRPQQRLTIVGYGTNDFATGGGAPPQPLLDLNRRWATAELLSAGTSVSDYFVKFNSVGQAGVCLGDSGGPDLLGDTDTIIAVNSLVNGTKCSSVAYGMRLDLPDLLAEVQAYL